MAEAFLVRATVAADYEAVCALFAEGDELHRVGVPWLFRASDGEPRSRELFEQLTGDTDSAVFVAEAHTLLGVATVLLRRAPELALFIPQTWAVLDNIAVSSRARRQGVGTALTRAAEHWARARGARWLELGVYEFNEGASSFYRALGYEPVLTKLRKPFG
jgi:ribosomal protein S18 acetylase RimI-like enzyme